MNELGSVDGALALIEVLQLLNDWHQYPRNVSGNCLNIDGIDTDTVIFIAIQAVEDVFEYGLFFLLNNCIALLVSAFRILLLVLEPDLFVLFQFHFAVLETVVVFVQNHASRKACVTLSATSTNCTLAPCRTQISTVLAVSLGFKGALSVEFSSLCLELDVFVASLLVLGLLIEALG